MSISTSDSEAVTSRRHWKFLLDLAAISSATDQRRSPRGPTARCRFAPKQFAVICRDGTNLYVGIGRGKELAMRPIPFAVSFMAPGNSYGIPLLLRSKVGQLPQGNN